MPSSSIIILVINYRFGIIYIISCFKPQFRDRRDRDSRGTFPGFPIPGFLGHRDFSGTGTFPGFPVPSPVPFIFEIPVPVPIPEIFDQVPF